MGTIELLKVMQEKCLNDYKYAEPLRMKKYRALDEAIKALCNQPKYEKALDMICDDYFDDMSQCPSGINVCKDEGLTCGRCIIEHYKKKAGIK